MKEEARKAEVKESTYLTQRVDYITGHHGVRSAS